MPHCSAQSLWEIFQQHPTISTDTRRIAPGSLFFALKGQHFDGNLFAAEALAKGAAYAIIDNATLMADERYLLVEDVLQSLQALAHRYRSSFSIPFIAIGGSNGKTTTKELIAAVLSQKYKTFATQGNLNNHIGVPLTLLSIPSDTEMAVIEMGANHLGEYEQLCQIAAPTHGLLTNIGLDHLEGFGSLEGVAAANSELYYYLLKNQGQVFVNTLEEHLGRMAARFEKPITYPQAQDDYSVQLLEAQLFLKVAFQGLEQQTQLIGKYNFANIATALCVGVHFGVSPKAALEAVGAYVPANNRSQLVQKNTNTIILDAYNANPSSMAQAIESFAALEADSKMVILGDMYELGTYSTEAHRALGALLAQQNFDKVVLYGEWVKEALLDNPKAYYFSDKFSLHNWLKDLALQNTNILIKGSRGVKLESVLDFI